MLVLIPQLFFNGHLVIVLLTLINNSVIITDWAGLPKYLLYLVLEGLEPTDHLQLSVVLGGILHQRLIIAGAMSKVPSCSDAISSQYKREKPTVECI